MDSRKQASDSRSADEQKTTPSEARRVSSPAATGAAGTFFEQHVAAYWLAQLLVSGIPPILCDSVVVEVHLQASHLGWHTDDFVIVGKNGSGQHRNLAGQVKRTLTISSKDAQCQKVVQDFWNDFGNTTLFSPELDRLALVILRDRKTLEHFSDLFDCARAARDGVDFARRIGTQGFVNAKIVKYCGEIATIISEAEGRDITVAELWPFLRVLHVLPLDLTGPTRQTEATTKTLLAYTTSEQDALGAAEATWNSLLREVGEGMPQAQSYQRDDLPEAIRQRHSTLGGKEKQALRALSDHSNLILASIRSTIGSDLHLTRDHLVQQVIAQLESAQVVMITGAAGSGKSVIAKDTIESLSRDHFAFSFRAEEFACPHLDSMLESNQVDVSATTLGAILASQGRKVLLVESIERLLEKSTRDAFSDLLILAGKDETWRLVLTCRDYSADLVRACFLESNGIGHSVVMIPALDDEELEKVQVAHPTLGRPLGNEALRPLMRNPYVLDKALQIQWSEDRPLPQSEREFRRLFWQEIVRVDHLPASGLPHLREEAFSEIALQRARALTLYAVCPDLDPEIVDALRGDSLIVHSEESKALIAPAHDVLEDWAILHWIDKQFAIGEHSARNLADTIGTYPAIRRTYRKWVSELVGHDPGAADGLFEACVQDGGLPAHFRDDTLISLLRSPTAPQFLDRHVGELFESDKELLRRIIHLLRVACVTTPTWLETTKAHPSLFSVPDGPSWASVLRLVHTHLGSFSLEDRLLLLGLIEDWARGVTWKHPYPEGAEDAAAIAHLLLSGFDDFHFRDQRKRTLQIIAKIPNGDRDRYLALLHRTNEDKEWDRKVEEFQDVIFEGLEGLAAARDMPEAVISAANDFMVCTEADLHQEWGFSSGWGLETLFGIKPGRRMDFFPASAYRGPFLHLLRQHPSQAIDFVIELFNHSADWYAHPRVREEHAEPPFEMTLTFPDGTTRTQWCNPRLWNLYRGTSVGPYVLQSVLMALERWLLELAEAAPEQLDSVLIRLLRRSNSATITAVVASVATAFPHRSGETLLVLLGSRMCFRLDRLRLVSESQAPSGLAGIFPQWDAKNEIYEAERKEADALVHRRHDLETAIANLQLGPLAPRVHEIIDQHRMTMPPPSEQSEDDRIWRLALHRMDLRQYTIAEEATEALASSEDGTPSHQTQQYVRLEPKEPEPDVQEMAEQHAAKFQATDASLGLLMWGMSVFERKESATYDPTQWREKLETSRLVHAPDSTLEGYDLNKGGPGYIAAVCVRDYWEELSGDEQVWCIETICSEVEKDANNWDRTALVQRYSMSADRPCAWVVPLLIGKKISEELHTRILRTLALALTHAIDEVRWYAASGIGSNLWLIDRSLTLRCIEALATEATFVQKTVDRERRTQLDKRRHLDEIEAEASELVRRLFLEENGIENGSYEAMDPTTWMGAEANGRILAILGHAPTEPAAVKAFERLAHVIVGWWDADDNQRRNRYEKHQDRNYQAEGSLQDILQNFLLRTSPEAAASILQPVLDAVDRHPKEVHWILLGLIGVEDRQPNTSQFWSLWDLFAERVRAATWLQKIDDEHASGSEMLSTVFLGSWWKDEVRHWRSLEGFADRIDALFLDLPPSSTVLDSYLRFLYHIGEQSLPQAFIYIARRLREGDASRMMRKGNTVFLLESLLLRFVYSRPLELKQQGDLREAVIFLLDTLIESGSSAAFRMRDDFVTPASMG